MSDPFQELGLDRDSSPETIRLRWRQLAAEHHPDKGGQLENFLLYQRLYREALETSLADPCPACLGKGLRGVTRGFASVWLECDVCLGLKKRWVS